MPLFNVKKEHTFMLRKEQFDQFQSGEKDVELRRAEGAWRNVRVGAIAVLTSGSKQILRTTISAVHRGTLGEILSKLDYKRMVPTAASKEDALVAAGRLYPDARELMAFELSAPTTGKK